MSTLTIVFGVVALALLVIVVVLLLTRGRYGADSTAQIVTSAMAELKSELVSKQLEGLVSLRESLDSATRTVNERLSDGTQTLDRRLALFTEIEGRLAKLTEQTRTLESIGKNIQSLSDLLRPPKLRGIVGEMLLENLLAQILPRSLFDLQHGFSDGRKVDAVVRLGESLIPIDSKFPLESFQRLAREGSDADSARRDFRRALRKHIDDIASRYIVPGEGTTDFAVMYIPSEAVYYYFVSDTDSDSLEYALSRRVIPSSPGHLYSFLASLSAVSTGLAVSADSRRLIDALNTMSEVLLKMHHWHERMESSIRHLQNNMGRAREEEQKMTDTLKRIHEPVPDAPPADHEHPQVLE